MEKYKNFKWQTRLSITIGNTIETDSEINLKRPYVQLIMTSNLALL